ncbi:hypothetical protein EVAR_12279_1 [Eumeta japonica]|uniref:Uncharacterized protein n=1 Tax=Eumeta variegata TaxID=151549 RepID=A0A4C1TU91_EUMVA|nr:hypothetical protein EVAR_12279_1 [Eumeta japonica]
MPVKYCPEARAGKKKLTNLLSVKQDKIIDSSGRNALKAVFQSGTKMTKKQTLETLDGSYRRSLQRAAKSRGPGANKLASHQTEASSGAIEEGQEEGAQRPASKTISVKPPENPAESKEKEEETTKSNTETRCTDHPPDIEGKKTIAHILQGDVKVISKGPQEDLKIRDLDTAITKDGVQAPLQEIAGKDYDIPLEVIEIRPAYRGTQTTSVILEVINEVEKYPWDTLYKVVMMSANAVTCPQLLQKIVTVLFSPQRDFSYLLVQYELESIPPITEEELMEAYAINLFVNTDKNAIVVTRWKGTSKEYRLVAALDIKNPFNSSNWDCIMQAFEEKNVSRYLRRIVASYFKNRVLKYDRTLAQGSMILPEEYHRVEFCDLCCVMVIVVKHLEEINVVFSITFRPINQWMNTVNLQLTKHKTETVLNTSNKTVETNKLEAGEQEITSQPFIRYLGMILEA